MDNPFGGFWDDLRGVFKDVLDFERFKFELQLAREANAFQARQTQQQAPVAPTAGFPVNANTLIWGGVLLLGGIVAWRVIK